MINANNIKNLWEHIHKAIKENPVPSDKEPGVIEMEAWELALSKAVDADGALPGYKDLRYFPLLETLVEFIDSQIETEEWDTASLIDFAKDEDADNL